MESDFKLAQLFDTFYFKYYKEPYLVKIQRDRGCRIAFEI